MLVKLKELTLSLLSCDNNYFLFFFFWCVVVVERGGVVRMEEGEGVEEDVVVGIWKGFITYQKKSFNWLLDQQSLGIQCIQGAWHTSLCEVHGRMCPFRIVCFNYYSTICLGESLKTSLSKSNCLIMLQFIPSIFPYHSLVFTLWWSLAFSLWIKRLELLQNQHSS